jgi:predicted DNA-binding protein
MARYTDDPVRHIVTFRVNHEEKRQLEQLAKQSGRTISDFVRRNLDLLNENEGLSDQYLQLQQQVD